MGEPVDPQNPEFIVAFLNAIDFELPNNYLIELPTHADQVFDFEEGKYLELWALVDLIKINHDYNADENYPGFFLIGTDDGGEACAIEKKTGSLYIIPFIGSLPEDAIFVGNSFQELMEYLNQPW
ncbi:hypothetical protein [Hymenobacter coccineus]|uniref:Knr4/Smi1-like domain-containing protein n=1 Tax=Hymenobacter coccineus TaxID=1908235 RepID=A0A1G1SRB1_9BACT|nr:hypothetical protein [Hymenobacter coccineus]OGX81171.1 hypothetical protein BEN49_15780 [Hymenobacter coccineus]